jgi:hypothetical protein
MVESGEYKSLSDLDELDSEVDDLETRNYYNKKSAKSKKSGG